MRKIVLDLETKNSFQEVGARDPSLLDVSLVGIYDSEFDSYKCFLKEEFDSLWPILESSDMIIGFNTEHFDIPILNKYYAGDLRSIKQLDIMREIEKVLGRRVGLSAVAAGTLGCTKMSDGMQAIRWWRDGAIDKIKEYCLDDVRITKEIYEHALQNGKLTVLYNNNNPFCVELDTSRWEVYNKNSRALTLPF